VKKSTPEAKKYTPMATNSDVVIEVASILEDVETSAVNLASPFMKEDEPGAKRYHPTPLTRVVIPGVWRPFGGRTGRAGGRPCPLRLI
jgi:hypothetical protein